jgi:hypothetical protein
MKALISLGVAFFVTVLNLLIGHQLTPALNLDTASNILFMTFISTAVITYLALKYRRGHTAMIRLIPISLGVGMVEFAFLYVTCVVPSPRELGGDAAIDMGVSALLASVVTFSLLFLPTPLSGEWRRGIISLSVAFFATVVVALSVFDNSMAYRTWMSIAGGVFVGTAVVTALALGRWGRSPSSG